MLYSFNATFFPPDKFEIHKLKIKTCPEVPFTLFRSSLPIGPTPRFPEKVINLQALCFRSAWINSAARQMASFDLACIARWLFSKQITAFTLQVKPSGVLGFDFGVFSGLSSGRFVKLLYGKFSCGGPRSCCVFVSPASVFRLLCRQVLFVQKLEHGLTFTICSVLIGALRASLVITIGVLTSE